MSLGNTFRDSIDKIYAVAGIDSRYTERDKNARSVKAIIDYDLSQYGEAVEVSKSTASLSVRVSEVEYPPRQGETFVIGTKTLVVDSALQSDELEHTVLVS